MESEEQWSCRDFTQIKPRRPEGPAEVEWEEEEEAPFSFLWRSGMGREELEEAVGGLRREHGEEEDGRSNANLEYEEEEFEFSSRVSMGMPAVVERLEPSGISPADELFFKGQLLPLHLPPRIQMVKKLSLEKQQQREAEEQEKSECGGPARVEAGYRTVHRNEEIIARVNALMQARFARLFQPKYSKFCISATEVASPAPGRLGNSWWDPRGSHAHETSSAASFTSTDRDSSDASSRDSSGSSQDCFDSASKEHFHGSDSKGFLHNREVFSTHSSQPGERASGISTWLRPPFKWKVLFGAKKSTTASSKSSSPFDIGMEPKAHYMEKAYNKEATPECFSTFPASTDRYYSDCSGELTPSGNLHVSSRAFIHGGDMEKYPRGMERARGYLQRYMKALNPSRNKDHHSGHGHGSDEGVPRASPAITNSRSFPPFSQSFRISPKDISLKMKRPPPASPPPGPRRVSTSSASSELHSAIQGAIAHCKESQKQSKQDDVLQNLKCVGDVQKVATD